MRKKPVTQFRASEELFKEIDDHLEEYKDDFEGFNHFLKTACKLLLESRRNKGKFKVYK